MTTVHSLKGRKISEQGINVRMIKAMYKQRWKSKNLAKQFRVALNTIYKILNEDKEAKDQTGL